MPAIRYCDLTTLQEYARVVDLEREIWGPGYDEVVPVPILCTVVFGTPVSLQPDEERRAFLDRARAAVVALREVVR